MNAPGKSYVAVVTGANTGVGFKLCERLVNKFPAMTLCLCCRNKEKAEQAVAKLRFSNPQAMISFVLLDTSNLKSVFAAAKQLKEMFSHIDYLYLNAGAMCVVGVSWPDVLKGLFSKKCIYILTTGDGLLIHHNSITEDGLQNIFATNVFGHYILLKELAKHIEESDMINQHPGQIIWTSSSNAVKNNLSLEDIQHKKGKDPYSSSKYLMDTISLGLNERMNKKNVFVHTTCPGLMSTNMTHGILSSWIWAIIFLFLFPLRIFIPSLTYSPENGSEALFWLANQDPASVGPNFKIYSRCGASGKSYVKKEKLKMSEEFAEEILIQLDALEDKFRKKYNQPSLN